MTTQIQLDELRSRRRRSQASRNAILQAALVEFAREGLAGARMDAIAEAAGVNKALLYYYFGDKEALYGAVLDRFFEKLAERIITVYHQPGTAGERFLAYVRTHFDSIAESPYYAHIFMSELMSASRGGSPHLDRIFARYMQPIGACIIALLNDGIRTLEFRPVDPHQFMPSAIGSIVHYFLTAPVRQKFMPKLDANSPEAVQQRRAAVLDFIAAALFADRDAGIELAARIAAQQTASLDREPVAPRKMRGPRYAASPPSRPAPTQPQPPMQVIDAAVGEPRQGGYRWLDRWFPDFETAKKVLQEEKRRHRRLSKPKPRTTSPDEGGPK